LCGAFSAGKNPRYHPGEQVRASRSGIPRKLQREGCFFSRCRIRKFSCKKYGATLSSTLHRIFSLRMLQKHDSLTFSETVNTVSLLAHVKDRLEFTSVSYFIEYIMLFWRITSSRRLRAKYTPRTNLRLALSVFRPYWELPY